jgi:hypothetical protein
MSSSRPIKGVRSRGPFLRRPPLTRKTPIERHWRRNALELVRPSVLNDEEPGDLPLDA